MIGICCNKIVRENIYLLLCILWYRIIEGMYHSLYKAYAATLTFALTTFKVQGKCKERVVLLLDRRPGLKNGFKNIDLHGVYVALSRVRYGKHIARLGKGGVDMFK